VRNFLEILKGKPAAVRRSNQRANAGTRDEANWNSFFFENFEDSDVGHATREASAESHADCGESGLNRNPFARQFPAESLHGPDNLAETFHRNPQFPARRNSSLIIPRMPLFQEMVQSTLVLHEVTLGRYGGYGSMASLKETKTNFRV
jgi:hypothetical protein